MVSIAEFFAWLKLATLASSVALIVILILRKPLRRACGAVAAHALWLLLPASLIGSLWPAPETALVLPAAQAVIGMTFAEAEFAQASAFDATPWWFAAWCAGVLAMLAAVVWQQYRFMRALGRLAPDHAGCWRAATSAGLPALVGVLRPRIVVPADFDDRYDATERRLMLRHESAHRRSLDSLCNAGMVLLRALFWFNPLLHWAAGRYRHDQELACDARVIAAESDARRAYASAMFKTQLASESLPLGCHWGQTHPLKERVMQIQKTLPKPRLRRCGVLLAGVLAVTAAYAAWAAQPPTMSAAGASLPNAQGDYRLSVQLSMDGAAPRTFALDETYGDEFAFHQDDVRVTGTVKPVRYRDKLAFRVQTRVLRQGEMPRSPMLVMANNHPAQIKLGEELPGGGFNGVDMTLVIVPRDAEASLAMAEEMAAVAEQAPAKSPVTFASPADHVEMRGDFVRESDDRWTCAGAVQIDSENNIATCVSHEKAARQAPQTGQSASAISTEVIHRVAPIYPIEAMRAGVTGSVKVLLTITADGRVSHADVQPRCTQSRYWHANCRR
ncbi:MAG: M56 family metallopeptidase [Pseudomonadota bacterium]|nr:M56 family metallopeptidase [Pseudomonadota bacterium]